MTERSAKIVNSPEPLIIFAKRFILDFSQFAFFTECASAIGLDILLDIKIFLPIKSSFFSKVIRQSLASL